MSSRDYRKGALQFPFQVIPKAVLMMDEFHALPFSAKALMLDLMAQYSGRNNGRLTTTFEAMQRAGWTSKSTLIRAKLALLEMPFVVMTRKGHAPRTTEWIAFTWWTLDWEKSMDIEPRDFHHLNFLQLVGDPNEGRQQASKNRTVVSIRNRKPTEVVIHPLESGPMQRRAVQSSVPVRNLTQSEARSDPIGPKTGEVLDVAISNEIRQQFVKCSNLQHDARGQDVDGSVHTDHGRSRRS